MQEMRERVVHAVQANLSLGTLSNLTVAIPSADITTKLVDLLFLTIDKKKLSNTQKINSLIAIRDTLLPQLIAGKISLNCTETTN